MDKKSGYLNRLVYGEGDRGSPLVDNAAVGLPLVMTWLAALEVSSAKRLLGIAGVTTVVGFSVLIRARPFRRLTAALTRRLDYQSAFLQRNERASRAMGFATLTGAALSLCFHENNPETLAGLAGAAACGFQMIRDKTAAATHRTHMLQLERRIYGPPRPAPSL